MGRLLFLFILLIFPNAARAQSDMDSYEPPPMFGEAPGQETIHIPEPAVTPPLPPRRPARLFASKEYLRQLRERQASSHKIVNLTAQEILEKIE